MSKYIPPHLRKSSANKPPPVYTNDSFSDQRNQNRFQRPSFHRTIQNNTNHRRFSRQRLNNNNKSLQERKDKIDVKRIEIIDLDKYIIDCKKRRILQIQIVSEYVDSNSAQLIIQFCNDDNVLIPNTFNRKEFLKYWFIVEKGEMINQYRNCHRVDLYTNYLQLIRRGAIASIKGYKPSKSAKLMLECKWKYRHSTDWMMLSLQSNGYRDPQHKFAQFGEVVHEGNRVTLTNRQSPHLSIWGIDKELSYTTGDYTSSISLNEEISMIITDDGQEFEVEVYCDKNMHSLKTDSIDTTKGFNRICVFNREKEGHLCDITFLRLSVVTNNAKQ